MTPEQYQTEQNRINSELAMWQNEETAESAIQEIIDSLAEQSQLVTVNEHLRIEAARRAAELTADSSPLINSKIAGCLAGLDKLDEIYNYDPNDI